MLREYHGVRDEDKLAELMAGMQANGWQGAPLVVWDDCLLTGSHRIAAWRALGNDDAEAPTITIEEIFEEADLDFTGLHAEHGYPTIDEHGLLVELMAELPDDIRDKYGIDLD